MHQPKDLNDTSENINTAPAQRSVPPTRLVFKAVFALMLAYFFFLLIANKAYVTAGATSWVFFALFVYTCVSALLSRRKVGLWLDICALVFALTMGYGAYFCIHYNGIDYEIIQVGKALHEQCNSEGRCPSLVPEYEQFKDMRYRRHRLHYYPDTELSSFDLYFHHGLDAGFLVKGGINKTFSYASVSE